jgi:hypothetical protein
MMYVYVRLAISMVWVAWCLRQKLSTNMPATLLGRMHDYCFQTYPCPVQ